MTDSENERFNSILNKLFDRLHSYAIALIHNSSEAEDLVQEACVRAIQAKGSLWPDSNIENWLLTILRNLCLNQLRNQRIWDQIIDLHAYKGIANIEPQPFKDPYVHYVNKLEHEQVHKAIRQLRAEFREVILLREFEELSYQEISAILGCPIGTVMSRLGRARSKLRVLLKRRFRGGRK
jgi:RNA polymerase sigma-70 factor, ECF subfamily